MLSHELIEVDYKLLYTVLVHLAHLIDILINSLYIYVKPDSLAHLSVQQKGGNLVGILSNSLCILDQVKRTINIKFLTVL